MPSFISPYSYGPIVEDWLANEAGITANDTAQLPNADGLLVLCNGLGPRKAVTRVGDRPNPWPKDILVYRGFIQRGGESRGYVSRPRRRV